MVLLYLPFGLSKGMCLFCIGHKYRSLHGPVLVPVASWQSTLLPVVTLWCSLADLCVLDTNLAIFVCIMGPFNLFCDTSSLESLIFSSLENVIFSIIVFHWKLLTLL